MRICPLWAETVRELEDLRRAQGLLPHSTERGFRNHRGEPLTRVGVRHLLSKHARSGSATVATLKTKRVHSHVSRLTTATFLLQSSVALVTIQSLAGPRPLRHQLPLHGRGSGDNTGRRGEGPIARRDLSRWQHGSPTQRARTCSKLSRLTQSLRHVELDRLISRMVKDLRA